MSNRHDIFNPEYKKKKDFFRKSNLYRLLAISLIIGVFVWGYRENIYATMMYYEIKDERNRIVSQTYLKPDGSTYLFYNKSPYYIRLEFVCNCKDFRTTYSDTILYPNTNIYISFYGNTTVAIPVYIKGVKVG
jgi:hypothetical protein